VEESRGKNLKYKYINKAVSYTALVDHIIDLDKLGQVPRESGG
jgi:hypothetical protein